jgi:hypothetical protein
MIRVSVRSILYHVVSGLTSGAGRKLVYAESTDAVKVQCLAYRGEVDHVMVGNLTAQDQTTQFMVLVARVRKHADEQSLPARPDPRGRPYIEWYDPPSQAAAMAVAIMSVND